MWRLNNEKYTLTLAFLIAGLTHSLSYGFDRIIAFHSAFGAKTFMLWPHALQYTHQVFLHCYCDQTAVVRVPHFLGSD
jgi:hypothetical protein